MAFCINCGAQLPEGAKFCASCGMAVAAEPQQKATPEEAPAPKQPAEAKPAKSIVTPVAVEVSRAKTKSKKKSSSSTWIPIVIIILLFCIALVIGVFKFKDLIFGKKIVAGPSDASTITTGTTQTTGSSSDVLPEEITGGSTDPQSAGETPDTPTTEDGSAAQPEENPGVSTASENKAFPTWAITLENINIRNGAGTSFEKKSKYFRGTIVILYEEKKADDLTWYRITKDGTKSEQWIADDGTWLDFTDPLAAALIGEDVTEEINFSIQYTRLAKTSDQYIWRMKTSQNNGTESLLLQNISDPATTAEFTTLIESDSSYEFLNYLWEQNDHNLVELKEITLAGYCRLSGTDADGNAFTKKGEVWYTAIGSKTANYFATKDEDGELKIEEIGLDKLFEAGWENCTENEYKAIN